MKFIFIFFLTIFSLLGESFLFYQVKVGDSYSKIAEEYDFNYLELYELNQKKKLFPQSIIKVPDYFYYKIKKGDSLFAIAGENNVKVTDLKKANPAVSTGKLYYDRLLKIPFPRGVDFINELKKKPVINPQAKISDYFLENQEKKIIPLGADDELFISLPFKLNWPLKKNRITHKVINQAGLLIETDNTPQKVYASYQGKVIFSGEVRGYGKALFLEHPENIYTVYLGLENITLKKNQTVKPKKVIGRMQKYLYFYVFKKSSPVNPLMVF